MKRFILGTAGHVDHGKSSLIKALTSVDTDRLPEEKERGLSIDLGFAPLVLSGPGEKSEPIELGVVDVPGHQRFLRNMIAGVGGFDGALLVVDCLEGVKPQTREHLEILRLLRVGGGVVVLSKVDRADEEAVEIARWELRELLEGTFLEKAPIVPTSALDGIGIEELKSALYELFSSVPERSSGGIARLPIDRFFSKTGFGSVVTGSLWSGRLRVGDEVQVLPGGTVGKVRGLQVHGEATEEVRAGQRVAVNVSGLSDSRLGRGCTLVAPPGTPRLGLRFALQLELLQPEPKLLCRKRKVTLYHATSHAQAVLHALAAKETELSLFAQLECAEPTFLTAGDRVLLRDETGQRLLAGGTVLAIDDKPYRKSRPEEFTARYQALSGGGGTAQATAYLKAKGGHLREKELKKLLGLTEPDWEALKRLLLEAGTVVPVGKDRYWWSEDFESRAKEVEILSLRLAQAAPWKIGWKPVELASLLGRKSGRDEPFEELLETLCKQGVLKRDGPFYSPRSHQPRLDSRASGAADALLRELESAVYSPGDWTDLLEEFVEDKKFRSQVEEFLFGTEQLVRLNDKIVTLPSIMLEARRRLASAHEQGFTPSEARQTLDTSRKYIIPILEWMDRQGWTVRTGDARKFKPF